MQTFWRNKKKGRRRELCFKMCFLFFTFRHAHTCTHTHTHIHTLTILHPPTHTRTHTDQSLHLTILLNALVFKLRYFQITGWAFMMMNIHTYTHVYPRDTHTHTHIHMHASTHRNTIHTHTHTQYTHDTCTHIIRTPIAVTVIMSTNYVVYWHLMLRFLPRFYKSSRYW